VSDRWKVYKQRDGLWGGLWIAQPPGASFDESFPFGTHADALYWAANPIHRLEFWLERQP
jgi:hypothetical protein